MKITVSHKGNFKKLESFLERVAELIKMGELDRYGKMGVEALAEATPKDTGRTSEMWDYEIIRNPKGVTISWSNSNVNDGVNIAVILQLGHGTGTGGYVTGIDYINPAMHDVFQDIADSLWKEITS